MYEGLIARVGNFQSIKGADFIVSADVLINGIPITQVVTSKGTKEGALGIYFCADIQLSEEYCKANNLLLLKDEQGNKIAGSGYLDPDKRRIKAQRFKGVKSDGLWMPIESLISFVENPFTLNEGDKVGKPLARRYPLPVSVNHNVAKSGRVRKELESFPEHYDTDQFMHCLGDVARMTVGLPLIFTEKLHGTSHRVGMVRHPVALKWYHKIINRVFKGTFKDYEYKLTHGTRRVILWDEQDTSGYYGSNQFRYDAIGEPSLPENTILYGEIVGYANSTLIMPEHSTKDVPEVRKKYGDVIKYDYGLDSGAKFYVYRVTVDGRDLLYDNAKALAEEYGYSFVPLKFQGTWDGNLEGLVAMVEAFTDDLRESILGNHPIEGICIRIGNRVWKHKTFAFKVMEGIVKPSEQEIEG